MRRKYFREGDRTNFTFYDSMAGYRAANPSSNSITRAFLESAIRKYGGMVYIDSVTDRKGRDISHLIFGVSRPDYVFGPSFKLGDSLRDKEMGRAVAKFIRRAEAAHEATKNSKLVFK